MERIMEGEKEQIDEEFATRYRLIELVVELNNDTASQRLDLATDENGEKLFLIKRIFDKISNKVFLFEKHLPLSLNEKLNEDNKKKAEVFDNIKESLDNFFKCDIKSI